MVIFFSRNVQWHSIGTMEVSIFCVSLLEIDLAGLKLEAQFW
jgi:hypothetical protein